MACCSMWRKELIPWLYPTLQSMPRSAHRPIVSLIQQHPSYPSVITDDENGSYQATRHLLELGHRHFLLMSSGVVTDTNTRKWQGTYRALREFLTCRVHHILRRASRPLTRTIIAFRIFAGIPSSMTSRTISTSIATTPALFAQQPPYHRHFDA